MNDWEEENWDDDEPQQPSFGLGRGFPAQNSAVFSGGGFSGGKPRGRGRGFAFGQENTKDNNRNWDRGFGGQRTQTARSDSGNWRSERNENGQQRHQGERKWDRNNSEEYGRRKGWSRGRGDDDDAPGQRQQGRRSQETTRIVIGSADVGRLIGK